MGFIEDEKRRQENLERERILDTPARREERERLWREETALRRGKLLEKSRAYFRESSTPKLVDELSEVVKGKVLLSEHGGFTTDLQETFDSLEKGEIWLRLDWDEEPVMYSHLDRVRSELRSRFGKVEPFSDSFSIYKSIGIVFFPSGFIRYLNGTNLTSISKEITYREWKGNKALEEASLEKVFKNPGKYLEQFQKPYFEGSPTSELAGPGSL
jgi:hypothetical protein